MTFHSKKKSDFPEGEPVLIWRVPRGAYWCENRSGYSDSVLNAGLYTREEAFEICFDSTGLNGAHENFAVPLREALSRTKWSREALRLLQQRINILIEHSDTESDRELARELNSIKRCGRCGRPAEGMTSPCDVCRYMSDDDADSLRKQIDAARNPRR